MLIETMFIKYVDPCVNMFNMYITKTIQKDSCHLDWQYLQNSI